MLACLSGLVHNGIVYKRHTVLDLILYKYHMKIISPVSFVCENFEKYFKNFENFWDIEIY